ncbi:hypothetical protein JYU34_004379 [Plutella xylostella]|uniref:FLYWCH-type domain-containing protein n=1 Tax=Plutella xylostella TaxID=51655 RepID=A0ABQ7QXV1_PLUXY|nr:hypothetical protein JYU34_004379 [Plutella xylostella]
MTSRAGESLMKVGDFTFTKDEEKEGSWCCYTHGGQGCRARVYTEGEKLVYVRNLHTHSPTEFFV